MSTTFIIVDIGVHDEWYPYLSRLIGVEGTINFSSLSAALITEGRLFSCCFYPEDIDYIRSMVPIRSSYMVFSKVKLDIKLELDQNVS